MKNLYVAGKFILVMSVLTGLIYPFVVTGLGAVFFPHQAKGSFIEDSTGRKLGSALIGQKFEQPKYFWPRPSAVDYKAESSGATNLGPTSKVLKEQIQQRLNQGLGVDMVFASASGLDPHISPAAAKSQVTRVGQIRGVAPDELTKLIDEHTEGRQFGFLGEPRVNVLQLNLALDERQ